MTIFTLPTTFYTLYCSGIYYKMKYITGLLALFVNCFSGIKALAQDPENFNKIYQQVFLEIAPENIDSAHFIADSLYVISTTPLYRTRSLMLKATLYQQQQQLEKSTRIAEQAYEIVNTTDDVNWKVRICGFLASQYRILQLYKKSKVFCDRALELIPEIQQPQAFHSTTGLVNQELAYYFMATGNYRSAIRHIQIAQQNFEQVTQNKGYFTAENEQLLGLNYFQLNQPEKALLHYSASLSLLKEMPDNHIRGLAYNGLSAVYIQQGNLPEAKKYIDSANDIANRSSYLQLKNEVLKTTQSYYLKVKDLTSLEEARKKQDSVNQQIVQRNTRFLDSSFVELEKTTKKAREENSAKNIPLAAGSLMLLLGGSYFYVYRRKQKQQYRLFIAYFEEKKYPVPPQSASLPAPGLPDAVTKNNKIFDANPTDAELIDEKPGEARGQKKRDISSMPGEETLQRLLLSLEDFEQQQQFTSGTITLSQLAAQFNTNIKYLSYVIKTCKEQDFNSYINKLRVDYITNQLKEQPQWRTYKISVLAEKAGFSSHGKFTTIFKGITGLSPSVFIRHLENEVKK